MKLDLCIQFKDERSPKFFEIEAEGLMNFIELNNFEWLQVKPCTS